MVVRLDRTQSLKLGEAREFLLSLLARLGCTEISVTLARTTITSTPRSVNDSISNLLVDLGGLWSVSSMAMNRATPSTRLQV